MNINCPCQYANLHAPVGFEVHHLNNLAMGTSIHDGNFGLFNRVGFAFGKLEQTKSLSELVNDQRMRFSYQIKLLRLCHAIYIDLTP